jgi:hypothetical protein
MLIFLESFFIVLSSVVSVYKFYLEVAISSFPIDFTADILIDLESDLKSNHLTNDFSFTFPEFLDG